MTNLPAIPALHYATELSVVGPFSPYLTIKEQGARRHLLWSGPTQPGSGQPIMHRWRGQKNVPVARIIYQAVYGSIGTHRLRHQPECKEPTCVSPMCFTVATPMEPAPLPDSLISERALGSTRRYKTGTIGGLRDRYTWHGDDMLLVECAHGGLVQLPMCPAHHVLVASWAQTGPGRDGMLGKQYRCGDCTRALNFARRIYDYRPRRAYRPTGPDTSSYAQEKRDMLASLDGMWDEPDD